MVVQTSQLHFFLSLRSTDKYTDDRRSRQISIGNRMKAKSDS